MVCQSVSLSVTIVCPAESTTDGDAEKTLIGFSRVLLPTPFLCCGFYASDTFVAWVLPRRAGKADGESPSDHIVAQQANRYIVAFHIAISSYDTQRPPYNGRSVGLPSTRCMYGLIRRTTVRANQCTAACETR